MLSSDQVNQYRRQGYCAAHGFLGSVQVAELLANAETICATATLANHDSTRVEMEPNQGPDGQKVRP
jgi:hypothetical protein